MATPKRISFKTELILEVEVSADLYNTPETLLTPSESIVEIVSVGLPNVRGQWVDLEQIIGDRRWKELQEEALEHD